jgi:hypothetical protein
VSQGHALEFAEMVLLLAVGLQQNSNAAQLEPAAAEAAVGVPPATRHAAAAVLTGQTARRIAAGRYSSQVPVAPQIMCHIDCTRRTPEFQSMVKPADAGPSCNRRFQPSTMHVGNSMPLLPGMLYRLHERLNGAPVRCASIQSVAMQRQRVPYMHAFVTAVDAAL